MSQSSSETIDVYFNFRSPYCYLASQTMFDLFKRFNVTINWRPLAGWHGRSAPERLKTKIKVVRQDVARICRQQSLTFEPPPADCDPSAAAAVSMLAQEQGKLEAFTKAVMHRAWGQGKDIGNEQCLIDIGEELGMKRGDIIAAIRSSANLSSLAQHWEQAQAAGVFGVPSFVINEQIFWGADRLGQLEQHLEEATHS